MGSGVALLDYDDDGLLDMYLVQGGDLSAPRDDVTNRLHRNRSGRVFEDVTDEVGGADPGYGMGAACGDVDGDGDTDLYVSNVGANAFYRNQDGTRLEDHTEGAGVRTPRLGDELRLLRFRPGRRPGPLRRELPALVARGRDRVRLGPGAHLLQPEQLRRPRAGRPVPERGRRDLSRRLPGGRNHRRVRERAGGRGRRLRRRRVARCIRRQRPDAEPAVGQPRGRHLRGPGAARGVRRQHGRPRPRPGWAPWPSTSRTTATSTCS